MAGIVHGQNGEKQMEKHIGCMSGFLQIFDRQSILAGKRIHSTKRLPASAGVGASPETVTLGEPKPPEQPVVAVPASPESYQSSPSKCRPKTPISELNNGMMKNSCKEMVRLSLDSRTTFDSKGSIRTNVSVISSDCNTTSAGDGDDNQRRSPSVIARLMGLETLSDSDHKSPAMVTKPVLQRSVSESRVSRDLIRSKYIDGSNFQLKRPNQINQSPKQTVENVVRDETSNVSCRDSENAPENLKSESSKTDWRLPRSFFDSADFFPEQNQTPVSIQSHDLSTLKQILEVLQLKGLLHSTRPSNRDSHRNFVYDRNLTSDKSESSIVLMKPWRMPASKVDNNRPENVVSNCDRIRKTPVRAKSSSPTRIESNLKSCNSIVKRKPLSIEIKRRDNESSDSTKNSPINSPKLTPKRTNRSSKPPIIDSPKQKFIKKIVSDDESNSISESTITTPERYKCEEYTEGKSLIQRCDKLLHSIAVMNNATESPPSTTAVLPSPVSVLDSVFDTPSSISSSHSIDFKATSTVDFDDHPSPSISTTKLTTDHQEFTSNDSDFIYISKILRASHHLLEDSSIFLSIEKQFYNIENTSNVAKQHRQLVFDAIFEIIDRNTQLPPRNTQLPPWKASTSSIKQIWVEFQKIRDTINVGDGLLDSINDVLKKDVIEITDWKDYPIETSEAVLDVERMIFKDLVSDLMRDFAEFSGERMFTRIKRKLVF